MQMFLDEARIAARLSHPEHRADVRARRSGDGRLLHRHGVRPRRGPAADRSRPRRSAAGACRSPSRCASARSVAEGLDHAHRATDDARQAARAGAPRRQPAERDRLASTASARSSTSASPRRVAKSGAPRSASSRARSRTCRPSRCRASRSTRARDMFSLGTMLYELTVGPQAVRRRRAGRLSMKILHDEPTPPELLVERYPDALREHHRAGAGQEAEPSATSRRASCRWRWRSSWPAARHAAAPRTTWRSYLDHLFPGERDQASPKKWRRCRRSRPPIPPCR